MPELLDRLPRGSRVLVIRIRSLGDCVLTTPALRLLKQHRPDLSLGVVVESRFAGVFEENADVDRLLQPKPSEVVAFRPDLCVNFHGGTRSMALTGLSLAKWRAGFGHHSGSRVYNVPIPRAQEILGEERKVHTAEHLASAMFYLGVPRQPIPRASLFAGDPPALPPYAVLHPFASSAEKAWPAGRFVEVARELRQTGLEPVIVAGPADDPAPFEGFRVLRSAPLSQVKALLKGAQLFLGNDSGPAHMAAAFGVRVVVLYGASDPVIWAPWRTESATIVREGGLSNVAVQEVLGAIQTLRAQATEARG
jgi:ADP-heptose:LPS heptosyltransferase